MNGWSDSKTVPEIWVVPGASVKISSGLKFEVIKFVPWDVWSS